MFARTGLRPEHHPVELLRDPPKGVWGVIAWNPLQGRYTWIREAYYSRAFAVRIAARLQNANRGGFAYDLYEGENLLAAQPARPRD